MVNQAENRTICTLFDHRYAARGITMIESIRQFEPDLSVDVLCLTPECYDVMAKLALPAVRLIPLHALEAAIPGLLEAKSTRSNLEYYFTCMAALHRYIFDTQPQVDTSMYIDSDMYFYRSPAVVFDEIGDAPAAIIPHNFDRRLRRTHEIYGLYNAGYSAFRRTEEGERCLNWWLQSSLQWCFDRVEGEKYANQKYLNQFPTVAPGTKILTNKGFDLAPWNVANFRVHAKDGTLFLDDDPLVFFHFHRLKSSFGRLFFDPHRAYRVPMPRVLRNLVYRPYVQRLAANTQRVAMHLTANDSMALKKGEFTFLGLDLWRTAAWLYGTALASIDIVCLRAILVWRGRAF